MTKIDMIKKVGAVVVSVGVGAIVGNAIKSTTPSSVNVITKICIGVGAFVLTGMASDGAVKYAEGKFDDTINQIKEMINEIDLKQGEGA